MEEFVDIPGYEGYKVNRLGQVMGKSGKILKPSLSRDGYLKIKCSYTRQLQQSLRVHRAVGLAFIPNPDNKPEIDHIDQNKLNNSVDNLRWATHTENALNRTYTSNTGEKSIRLFQPKPSHTPLYMVQINRGGVSVFCKYFKTLPEAIAARDEFLNNNNLG